MNKLNDNELENVNGGGCGAQHVLKNFNIKITYSIPNQSGTKWENVVHKLYWDDETTEDGKTLVEFAQEWCNTRGYSFCRVNCNLKG